jgi:hypothetical protein
MVGKHTAWPPGSPDFSPSDFYEWGHSTSSSVNTILVGKKDALGCLIVDACHTIHN